MCMNSDTVDYPASYSTFCCKKASYGHRLRIHRLNRRRREAKEQAEMKIKNWKLYMQNKIIIEENESLREKALLLHQENQVLLSQLQKKHSQSQNKLAYKI